MKRASCKCLWRFRFLTAKLVTLATVEVEE